MDRQAEISVLMILFSDVGGGLRMCIFNYHLIAVLFILVINNC